MSRNTLCQNCGHVRIVTTPKGSLFWLCLHAAEDPQFPKYPPQPVVHCHAHLPPNHPVPSKTAG